MENRICSGENCSIETSSRCSRCRKVYYCSQKCLELDWPVHRKNCKKKEKPAPGLEKNIHSECWKPVKNPVTGDVLGVVDPKGSFFKVIKEDPDISKRNNKSEQDDHEAFFPSEEKKLQASESTTEPETPSKFGKVGWVPTWKNLPSDDSVLQFIYILCSYAGLGKQNPEKSSNSQMYSATRQLCKFANGFLVDAGYRRVLHINQTMKESIEFNHFGQNTEAAELSVCKVRVGNREVEVNEVVVEKVEKSSNLKGSFLKPQQGKDLEMDDKFTMRGPHFWDDSDWLQSDSKQVLFEITVKSEISNGDDIEADLDLGFVREILSSGRSSKFRRKIKPMYGLCNLCSRQDVAYQPNSSLLSELEHSTDVNCKIVGISMEVKGSA